MLILSIGIFVIDYVVVACTVRGRIVQLGEFCKHCRFDFDDVIVTNEPIASSQSSMPHPDHRVGRVVTEPADD